MIDTGGITSIDKPKLEKIDKRNPQKRINELVRSQSIIALEQANTIIFVTDVAEGWNLIFLKNEKKISYSILL